MDIKQYFPGRIYPVVLLTPCAVVKPPDIFHLLSEQTSKQFIK